MADLGIRETSFPYSFSEPKYELDEEQNSKTQPALTLNQGEKGWEEFMLRAPIVVSFVGVGVKTLDISAKGRGRECNLSLL